MFGSVRNDTVAGAVVGGTVGGIGGGAISVYAIGMPIFSVMTGVAVVGGAVVGASAGALAASIFSGEDREKPLTASELRRLHAEEKREDRAVPSVQQIAHAVVVEAEKYEASAPERQAAAARAAARHLDEEARVYAHQAKVRAHAQALGLLAA